MSLHELSVAPGSRKPRKRLGRGMSSGHGKTSGKGHKGQMARKGHKHKLAFEGGQIPLIRRIPKRGFKNPTRIEYAVVNLSALEAFEAGSEIGADQLRAKGLVKGAVDGIKILGRGEISRALTVKVSAFSASARAKIEAVGGTCETV